MKAYFGASDSYSVRSRCTVQMLLLFLTGILLGYLLVRYFGLSGGVFSGVFDEGDLSLYVRGAFPEVLLSMGKFLLLLYLLGFQRWGAMMVPPVFGIEGIFFGVSVCGLVSALGARGVLLSLLLMLFRLILVVPFGFLLGGWAVEHSLSFPQAAEKRNSFGVLAVTLAVLLLAAFLDCTLARWLGGMYYLKFGV